LLNRSARFPGTDAQRRQIPDIRWCSDALVFPFSGEHLGLPELASRRRKAVCLR
jgi:hypothetical protein